MGEIVGQLWSKRDQGMFFAKKISKFTQVIIAVRNLRCLGGLACERREGGGLACEGRATNVIQDKIWDDIETGPPITQHIWRFLMWLWWVSLWKEGRGWVSLRREGHDSATNGSECYPKIRSEMTLTPITQHIWWFLTSQIITRALGGVYGWVGLRKFSQIKVRFNSAGLVCEGREGVSLRREGHDSAYLIATISLEIFPVGGDTVSEGDREIYSPKRCWNRLDFHTR